jgi:hypothetical protein
MSRQDRRARSAAARERGLQRIRATARRPLAPRRTRVRLAVGYLLAVALTAAAQVFPTGVWSILGALSLFAAIALWILLRRATSLVVDATDDMLDDMLIRLREHAFLEAYRFLAAITITAAAALFVLTTRLPGPALSAMGLILLGTAVGLPVLVAAITLPDTDPPEPA